MLRIFSFSEKTHSQRSVETWFTQNTRALKINSTDIKGDNRLMEAGTAAEEKVNCALTALFFTNGLAVAPSAHWVMI